MLSGTWENLITGEIVAGAAVPESMESAYRRIDVASGLPQYTVEIERMICGVRNEETAAFYTREEAEEWAGVMLSSFGYRRAWINGIIYTEKGNQYVE